MIEVFKIIKHIYDHNVAPELIYNINKVTTENDFYRSHYDLRKFSFTNRIVNIWNSLPNAVVDVDSVEVFKSRLDNFWKFLDKTSSSYCIPATLVFILAYCGSIYRRFRLFMSGVGLQGVAVWIYFAGV